ncbi:MAG: MBL fold metallo-hydrolase [Bradymonadia bacterium]
MSHTPAIEATFWGVRGSIATPGASTVRYGGNTPCLEIRAGGQLLIFDAGTGIRGLGAKLMREGGLVEAHLFFTHLHWDHIQGFPFFTPAFVPGNQLTIYGQHDDGERSVKAVLERQMVNPNFPVPLSVMRSEKTFEGLQPGDVVQLGEVTVRTAGLNHPGGCLGLRVDHKDRSLVFCTDTEHDPDASGPDEAVVGLARDADILIYDATFTEEEYLADRRGWGHSTYEEAVRVARAAGVRRLYFFHHDPAHDDAFLDARLAEARAWTSAERALTVDMAREGETLTL